VLAFFFPGYLPLVGWPLFQHLSLRSHGCGVVSAVALRDPVTGGQAVPGMLGLAAFPWYGVRGLGAMLGEFTPFQIREMSFFGLKTCGFLSERPHTWSLQPQEKQQSPENSETADFGALETVIS